MTAAADPTSATQGQVADPDLVLGRELEKGFASFYLPKKVISVFLLPSIYSVLVVYVLRKLRLIVWPDFNPPFFGKNGCNVARKIHVPILPIDQGQ